MDISEIISIAWNGVTSNKLRSILTMLGVIIGVAAVIMVIAVSAGTEANIASQIENLGTNLLFVTQNFTRGGPRTQTNNTQGFLYFPDAAAIATIPGVTGVETERNSSQNVQFGDNTVDSVAVVGTEADFTTVRDSPIGEGRFITQSDVDQKATVCVLGTTLAQSLFGSADPVDQKVLVGNWQLTVVGVLAPRGTVGGTDYDGRIYLPITTVFERYTPSQFARVIGDRINTIVVQVADQSQMDNTVLQIRTLAGSAAWLYCGYASVYCSNPKRCDYHSNGDHLGLRYLIGSRSGCLAGCGRHRHYEHHVGQCDRAHA